MSYVYEELNTRDIANALMLDDHNGYSREGCFAIAEMLQDYAESTGEPISFDHVAIRCEYTEYENWKEVCQAYCGARESTIGCEGDDEKREAVEQWLENRTHVVRFDNGYIVQDF